MKTTIAVYDSHKKALKALDKLKDGGFPLKNVSLMTKAEETDNQLHLRSGEKLEATEVNIGVIAGPVLGTLTGIGLFAIPGFGFMFGAGAIVGALAGFDFGLIGGGVLSFLTMLGVSIAHRRKYHTHLTEGKYLLIIQGTPKEVAMAKAILEAHGEHLELNMH